MLLKHLAQLAGPRNLNILILRILVMLAALSIKLFDGDQPEGSRLKLLELRASKAGLDGLKHLHSLGMVIKARPKIRIRAELPDTANATKHRSHPELLARPVSSFNDIELRHIVFSFS